jgi:tRNA (cytidine/uridine-2'-O-)-methyltransferase
VATACALHLIHPLGFELSEKACRRAGLDYWPRLTVFEHSNWGVYLERPARRWLLTTKTTRSVYDAQFQPGDHLIFGKETAGLPPELCAEFPDHTLTLPMVPSERSLNLATAVCAVVYEGIRQLLARGIVGCESGRLRA